MTLPYREGTLFAVPLRQGGFAVGVVARAAVSGRVVLCYFFGPRRMAVPSLAQVDRPDNSATVCILRVGDLSLLDGGWPIIGPCSLWERSEWPVPAFVRKDELACRAWRVEYSDDDPSKVLREHPEPFESALERDALFGAGAAELVLTRILE